MIDMGKETQVIGGQYCDDLVTKLGEALNEGWEIVRVDTSAGYFLYILEKPKGD